MRLQFDGHQPYQLDALQAALGLFEGRALGCGLVPSEVGLANDLALGDDRLLHNLRAVQARHDLPPSERLDGRHFAIEMETGTGKTYVYLRTIRALHARYGFSKFIIVVPSVAIREGVLKTLAITRDHFDGLYGRVPIDAWVYDAAEVSRLRQFAASPHLQVLVLNIDAFNKQANNVIHRPHDRLAGRRPIEFIQGACPIVILDEPQNMESPQARSAIESLHPLLTLRYSATHRHRYNLIYRLDPVRAYDLRLVKRIEVDAVVEEAGGALPYVHVERVAAGASGVTARLRLDVASAHGPVRKAVSIGKAGTDLRKKTGLAAYEGLVVEAIDARTLTVRFTNGLTLGAGQTHGGYQGEVMREQIRETIREHFEKELHLATHLGEGRRLKVLSLFFIDRVAHYAEADGRLRRWFEEAYRAIAAEPRYQVLRPLPVAAVHGGYFAQAQGRPKDTNGQTRADDEAYALIMRDKERLLSPDEPLRFIFSHSALREGWDNPNVFQICTLNETRSEIKKRQEIGRGLRLPVFENGERCFDPAINRLTVIANERYQDFARQLQAEIEDECAVRFEGRILNKRERRRAALKPGWAEDPAFRSLWERLGRRSRYTVALEGGAIAEDAAERLAAMPPLATARLGIQKAELTLEAGALRGVVRASRQLAVEAAPAELPDFLSVLAAETGLTRATVAEVLTRSGRLADAALHPQAFIEQASEAMRQALAGRLLAGVRFVPGDLPAWDATAFERTPWEGPADRLVPVSKSIHDGVFVASDAERAWVEALEARPDVRLFLKLPPWYAVDTPLGPYTPGWAALLTSGEVCVTAGDDALGRCAAGYFEAIGVGLLS